MSKTSVLINKAIAVGQCILDKSKELMYELGNSKCSLCKCLGYSISASNKYPL